MSERKKSLRYRLYHGETSFDFMGRKRLWFVMSGIVIALGLVGASSTPRRHGRPEAPSSRRSPPPRSSRVRWGCAAECTAPAPDIAALASRASGQSAR